MAVRSPLYWDAANNEVRAMTTAQVTEVCQRAIYQYSQSPSVTLVYAAGIGNLNAIDDTRMQAGSATTGTTAYATEAATPDISQVTNTYDNVTMSTNSPVNYPTNADLSYPVYWDSTAGEIVAMSQQDMIDTFVTEAIDLLASGNNEATTTNKGGSYTVSTSNSLAGATLVDANPIYIDTRADVAAYTAASIPESLDQPATINSYYLHKWDGDAAAGATVPLCIETLNGVTDLVTPTDGLWDGFLLGYMQTSAETLAGYRIGYQIDTASNANSSMVLCGSAMVDTRLNGTSAAGYNTRLVNVDDYRTQEFPNGVATTINTYGLYVYKY
jgi:hypothetical protein